MNRRRVLAAVGLGFSITHVGCLTDDRSADGSGDSDGAGGSDETRDESDLESEPTVEEEPRVTTPPHEITRPERPEPPEENHDEWNDAYLGEQMRTEPSLAFDTRSVPVGRVRETGLGGAESPAVEAYEARVVTDADEYEAVFDGDGRYAVDFDESVLVLVESGFGSSSVDHRWARVEAEGDSVHLHGYYTDPYEQSSDLDTRFSALEVERPPEGVDLARVSLTVDPKRRVHFNSTEGVVTLGD